MVVLIIGNIGIDNSIKSIHKDIYIIPCNLVDEEIPHTIILGMPVKSLPKHGKVKICATGIFYLVLDIQIPVIFIVYDHKKLLFHQTS